MTERTADAVIIGAGVIGASIAYQLAKRGVEVILLDKNEPASGTSGACDGLVFCQSKKPGIHLTMALESKNILESLKGQLPCDMEYVADGGLVTIESEAEYEAMAQYVKNQQTGGLDVSLIDGKEARELEPALSERILGAAYSPVDGQVNPLTLNLGLALGARNLGAQLCMHEEAVSIEVAGNRVVGVTTTRGRIATGTVINAAGIYAPAIAEMIGLELPIKPRRGQLLVTEALPKMLKTCMISASYIASKYDPSLAAEGARAVSIEQTEAGTLLLGSTREFVGFDRSTTPDGIARISANATRVLPGLEKVQIIRTIAGLRPYTPDGLPILGRVDSLEGFIMAAGHEGDGIALAAITGHLIAQLVTSDQTDIPLDQFSASRFNEKGQGATNE